MIRYLSRCWGEVVKNKKVLEKRKKFLTNENGYDKIIKLLKNGEWLKELNKKVFEKTLKKFLTSLNDYDKIIKSLKATKIEHWKLNNQRTDILKTHQFKWWFTIKNQEVSRDTEQKKLLIESLILAQDERWRRA